MLKEITPQPGLDASILAQLRQQFQREVATLARLNHPNLVQVTDFFEYIVLQSDGRAVLPAHSGNVPPELLDKLRADFYLAPAQTAFKPMVE